MLEKLEQHPKFASARTVLLYYSLDDEVQTHDFVEKWHRQKTVLLPVVKGDELELRIYTGRQNLKTGEAYHIEEPTGEAFIVGDLPTAGSFNICAAREIVDIGVLNSCVILLMKSFFISVSFFWRNTM